MTANDELKPCPFCGGEVELTTYRNEGWQIECENHDWQIIEWGQPRNASDLAADIGMFTWGLGEDAKAALIEAWNTRTPEQSIAATLGRGTCEWELVKHGPLYDVFECSACSYEYSENRTDNGVTDFYPNYCPNCGRRVKGGAE